MKIAIHVNCRGYYSSRGSAAGGGAMATLILGIYLVSYPHGTQFYVIQAGPPLAEDSLNSYRGALFVNFLSRAAEWLFMWQVVSLWGSSNCTFRGYLNWVVSFLSHWEQLNGYSSWQSFSLFALIAYFILIALSRGLYSWFFSQFKQLNGFSLWIGVSIQWLSCCTFKGTVFLNFLSPCEQLNGR